MQASSSSADALFTGVAAYRPTFSPAGSTSSNREYHAERRLKGT